MIFTTQKVPLRKLAWVEKSRRIKAGFEVHEPRGKRA